MKLSRAHSGADGAFAARGGAAPPEFGRSQRGCDGNSRRGRRPHFRRRGHRRDQQPTAAVSNCIVPAEQPAGFLVTGFISCLGRGARHRSCFRGAALPYFGDRRGVRGMGEGRRRGKNIWIGHVQASRSHPLLHVVPAAWLAIRAGPAASADTLVRGDSLGGASLRRDKLHQSQTRQISAPHIPARRPRSFRSPEKGPASSARGRRRAV